MRLLHFASSFPGQQNESYHSSNNATRVYALTAQCVVPAAWTTGGNVDLMFGLPLLANSKTESEGTRLLCHGSHRIGNTWRPRCGHHQLPVVRSRPDSMERSRRSPAEAVNFATMLAPHRWPLPSMTLLSAGKAQKGWVPQLGHTRGAAWRCLCGWNRAPWRRDGRWVDGAAARAFIS
jgi:hypothetical protein